VTPDRPDVDVAGERLRAMERTIGRLETLRGSSAEDLRADFMREAAAERLLQVLVDLALDVNGHLATVVLGRAPTDGRGSFLDVAEAGVIPSDLAALLAPSAGFRNVLMHQYVDIDVEEVARSIDLALGQFPRYVITVGAWLHRNR
jgi:uncharacterized protein YutE (UPF0331/DUF86 family)